MKRSRYTIATIIILIVIFVGLKAFEWWNTTYWDEIRYFAPSWTPDNKICFIKEIKNNSKLEHIYFPLSLLTFGLETVNSFGEPEYYLCSMDIDGSNKKEIAKMPQGYTPDLISWARNNSVIVLSGKIDIKGQREEIKIASLKPDGTQFKYISDGAMADVSSDGSKIAYVNNGIWIANIDGSNQKNIQKTGFHPLWSPDGKVLGFENYINGRYDGNYISDINNSNNTKIWAHGFINWSQDNNHIWTAKGMIDAKGKLIKKYPEDYNGKSVPYGPLSPDSVIVVSAFRRDDFYIGDINGNETNTLLAFQMINYGNTNRKQMHDIWIQ